VNARYASFLADVTGEVRACGRHEPVTIVAVSKKQPAEAIVDAIQAGVTDIGENYVREARAKFAALPPVRKHFIGHLQTNKAKAIAATFDMVQSIDRLEAGVALARAAQDLGMQIPVLLQVNVSPAERYGVPPARAEGLADQLRGVEGIRLDGVMAIGPNTGDREEITRAFELAAMTFGRVGGSTLSIGMSGDWREAVRAGSTMLRIGTAIFGPRAADLRPAL
jgi:pyridoxal phosphate enzyme (YggS family)